MSKLDVGRGQGKGPSEIRDGSDVSAQPRPVPLLRPHANEQTQRTPVAGHVIALAVIIVGVSVSILIARQLQAAQDENAITQFKDAASERTAGVDAFVHTAADSLMTLGDFYASSDEVRFDEFRAFSSGLMERSTAIYGLRWAPFVPAAQRSTFEQSIRNMGGAFERFHIIPFDSVRPGRPEIDSAEAEPDTGPASDALPILYIIPENPYTDILGVDILSEPSRRGAVEQARDTGQLTMTQRVYPLSVSPADAANVFVSMYEPLYSGRQDWPTVAERREHFRGILILTLRINQLLHSAVTVFAPGGVDIAIYSEPARPGAPTELLTYHLSRTRGLRRSDGPDAPMQKGLDRGMLDSAALEQIMAKSPIRWETSMQIAGRQWQFRCSAAPAFIDQHASYLPLVSGVAGTIISLLLGGYMFLEAGRVKRTEQLVRERTAELSSAYRDLQIESDRRLVVQDRLRLAQQFNAQVIDCTREGIAVLDREFKCELWNHCIEELTLLDASTVIARRPWEVMPIVEPRTLETQLQRALNGEWVFVPDLRWVNPINGQGRWLSIRYGPLRSHEGSIVGILVTVSDITDRKEAELSVLRMNASLEQRVSERTAQLEEANADLEAFAYSVSHDLRAPLRAVSGFSEILLNEHSTDLDPQVARYLGLVRGNAVTMGNLIDDLLKFSRLGRQPLRVQPVGLEEMAHQVVDDLTSSEAPGRQVQVRIDSLPQCEGDPALVRQVLINLLANALKYTRSRDQATIELGWSRSASLAGQIVYHVKDNGVGFSMDYAHKLFGVFQRLHSAEEFEGTGVGLAIVQRIVQRHGGRVWAEAAEDKGATFFFSLPEATAA